MADMEKQIRALETRRRAGEKVPELDVLYSKMDADTNKGHDAATKKQPPVQPPKPSMFKRIFGIPTGQERTDKLKQDIEKMKKGGMPMKNGKPAFMMKKKMMGGGMAKYAKGGSVSSRGDGVAQRGKTKGRFV